MSGAILGAILVGGHSTRMGSDKAAVVVAGQSMFERVRAAVVEVCDDVVTVGGEGCDVVDDRRHPLGGIAALLAARAAHRFVVVAVDQPLLSAPLLRRLVDACDGDDVGVCYDGEPLPMVLGPGRRDAASALIAAQRLRLLGLITKTLPSDDDTRRALLNVNRPDDVAVAEAAARHTR